MKAHHKTMPVGCISTLCLCSCTEMVNSRDLLNGAYSLCSLLMNPSWEFGLCTYYHMVATGQGKVREIGLFFKVRELSGNLKKIVSEIENFEIFQGKLSFIREK